jgi:protein-disulfide isomerase
MPILEKEYIDTGKVRYIYRPLGDFKDRQSRLAAESIYCAGEQGKFWELHYWMYENVGLWSSSGDVIGTLVGTAAPALGLDGTRLGNCLNQERYSSRVTGFVDDATQRGIYSTPTFLINDRLLEGAQSIDTFRTYIEEALTP